MDGGKPRAPSKSGIATKYAGIWFRSRTEARWAAFFDQVGWRWDYEPIDLAGYIPDFVLHFHKPLLVEVKPSLQLCQLFNPEYLEKIEKSGWDGETLLVGAGPFADHTIGILDGPWHGVNEEPLTHDWGAAIFHRCSLCGEHSFHHAINSFFCRVNGCWDGDHYLSPCSPINAWRESCNITQWRPTAGARIARETAEAKKAIEYKPQLTELSERLWNALNPGSSAPPPKGEV